MLGNDYVSDPPTHAVVTLISSAHFDELLAGVNALRTANGWAGVTWQAILPANMPPPVAGSVVYAAHIRALREQMTLALSGLGVPTVGYDDPDLDAATIKATHVEQLRGATR